MVISYAMFMDVHALVGTGEVQCCPTHLTFILLILDDDAVVDILWSLQFHGPISFMVWLDYVRVPRRSH